MAAVHPAASRDADPDAERHARARRVREHIVDMCAGPEGGHLGGSMSLVEILITLYFDVMRVDPRRPDAPDRDILVLSKGHGAICLYAVLAERGYFPVAELGTYARPGSRLIGHPVRAVPGVEMPTGSLGHGLALANGFALAARGAPTGTGPVRTGPTGTSPAGSGPAGTGIAGSGPAGARPAGASRRCFAVLGDGELQEGSVWEAAMAASSLGLDNLTVVVDRNRLQITGGTENTLRLEPLADRWRSFGWTVSEVDGHDFGALRAALTRPPDVARRRPGVVIAHTVKGRGLPFIEGRVHSHYATLRERQHRRARGVLAAQDGKAARREAARGDAGRGDTAR
jgi:transketolase